MNWLILMVLLADTTEVKELPSEVIEPLAKPTKTEQLEPNIELLLFLAEWEDSDNDQWLDPEIFATEDSMNQQLDTQKAKHHETDPDHN